MNFNRLVPYARGVVAENKLPSTDKALVVPIEILPQLDGEIAVEDVEVEDGGTDANGKTYTVKVKQRLALKCNWLPLGSNRVSSPDVRRGERVMIWRYADQDRFYWSSLGLDDHLRRLETVVMRFSGLPDGTSDDELNDSNSYFISVSTHTGMMAISTSKANKEPFAYKIQLNTKEGVFVLTDDIGNYIQLDSGERKISLENANGTELHLDKDQMFGKAITNIFMEAGKNMTFKAGENVSWEIGGNESSNIAGNRSAAVGGNDTVETTGNMTHTAAAYAISAQSFGVSATTGVMKASFSIDGTMLVKGAATFQAAIDANGITSSKPITGPSGTI